ncbi:MAG: shikimate kinase [Acidobacteriota bacterium]
MGAGKSTVGVLLAEHLGLPFIDLDQQIEDTVGTTIPEIFQQHGEAAFRAAESAALQQLQIGNAAVVATGGGLPTRAENVQRMRERGIIAWLDVPFDTIAHRLTPSKGSAAIAQRPLFQDLATAQRLFQSRVEIYREAADLRLHPPKDQSAEETAAFLAKKLAEKRSLHTST